MMIFMYNWPVGQYGWQVINYGKWFIYVYQWSLNDFAFYRSCKQAISSSKGALSRVIRRWRIENHLKSNCITFSRLRTQGGHNWRVPSFTNSYILNANTSLIVTHNRLHNKISWPRSYLHMHACSRSCCLCLFWSSSVSLKWWVPVMFSNRLLSLALDWLVSAKQRLTR